MPALLTDEFKQQVTAKYAAAHEQRSEPEMVRTLQGSTRPEFMEFLITLLRFEHRIENPPTGDPDTIDALWEGELNLVVDLWQRSLLQLPRAVVSGQPNPESVDSPDIVDSDSSADQAEADNFRSQVLDRYDNPTTKVTESELRAQLGGDVYRDMLTIVETLYQLHLIIEDLARENDPDVLEMSKIHYKNLDKFWQATVLDLPRVVIKEHKSAFQKTE